MDVKNKSWITIEHTLIHKVLVNAPEEDALINARLNAAEHLQLNYEKCPYCGEKFHPTLHHNFDFFGRKGTEHWECLNCKTKWIDTYKLIRCELSHDNI